MLDHVCTTGRRMFDRRGPVQARHVPVQTGRMLFLPADLPEIDGIAIRGEEVPGLLLLPH
jgi:hypothetical protein